MSMSEHAEHRSEYNRPTLTEYGSVEEWTQACTSLICISVILP
jgi:hypothetical protein